MLAIVIGEEAQERGLPVDVQPQRWTANSGEYESAVGTPSH
jgi:hypothetical protein